MRSRGTRARRAAVTCLAATLCAPGLAACDAGTIHSDSRDSTAASVRTGGSTVADAAHASDAPALSAAARSGAARSASNDAVAATKTTVVPSSTGEPPPPRRPLAGEVIGIDPGHNGRNYSDPSYIDRLVWNGREQEACDTTGTETDGGYTEARFNFAVASYLASDLRRAGARVLLTRASNDGVGPCVDQRSRIIDRARADVAIDIHADGGPPSGRGFAILEPVPDGVNDRVVGASRRFGSDLLRRYRAITHMPLSDYDGTNGISLRDDLAGLNLTTVPKVLIECGNMRNATDASRLEKSSFQRIAATALADAIAKFLHRRIG